MRRVIAIVLVAVMLFSLCACGSSGSNGNAKDSSTNSGNNLIDGLLNSKSDDDLVDIYHSVMDFEGIGAEAYIENLRKENPENQYKYYNENYYIETITEGERKSILKNAADADAFFTEVFATEFPGMYIKAELNRDMDELTLYFNREIYESNLFTGFAVLVIGATYMDTLQAYNLVSPEQRNSHFVCVDENGEVLLDSDSFSDSASTSTETSTIAKAAYTLTDYVVVDNEHCTFTVKSIDASGSWGFTLNVFCENKTDKTLMFAWENVSVMGYMVDPFWATEVAAGKKANASITFYYSDLEKIGMAAVDDVTFTLRVIDSNDWMADPILVEEYSIYPTGKSIQEIAYPERRTNDAEFILYDNNEYCVIILSSETVNGDFLVNYYLENKTGHDIMFSMDEVSVNGYMADPFWGTSVAAGKKLYATAYFYEYLLSENDIDSVEEIEFTLRVTNANSWNTHAAQKFTYVP